MSTTRHDPKLEAARQAATRYAGMVNHARTMADVEKARVRHDKEMQKVKEK